MENTALILISVALVILVIIMALLTVLVYKLFKETKAGPGPSHPESSGEAPHPDVSKSDFHPDILARMKEMERVKHKSRADLFCPNHPDEPGEVTCAICDKLYCKACVRPFKSMHFCKEHLPLIMRHEWEEILTLKTSTSDPEQGVKLYDVKKRLFESEDITTYVETHYKINVDQDYIETYLVLYAIKENKESVRSRFADFAV